MSTRHLLAASLLLATVVAACGSGGADLTVYSGRSEVLVGPLIERFEQASGLDVEVRYAGSTELAATILEEGTDSPADVFFAQDPASLGAVAQAGLLRELPPAVLALVPARFSDSAGRWVGISGRVRVAVVGPDGDGPLATVQDLTDPAWEGRLGIAPSNGSFLSFLSAMIILDGEQAALEWLEAMEANDVKRFDGNSAIVAAVEDGDIDAGLINHYYLMRLEAERGAVEAENVFIDPGGPGALVMPAGAGVLVDSDDAGLALDFIMFLLATPAQQYFAEDTFEYPLLPGVPAEGSLPPIDSLSPPVIDLSRLADVLDRATDLVAEAGLL